MDWGFVKVEDWLGNSYRVACFAMICHHCGTFYVEFFPNARQENLFIGMIHAFMVMGVPEYVLTDNMKSVVLRRDSEGKPVWHTDYAAFMACVGFKTKLCKPRHPFTKGKVERLIRFVKENFLAGKAFLNITELNESAQKWCQDQGLEFRKAVGCIPHEKHTTICSSHVHELLISESLSMYLCPRRKISFDGFVNYEGRRFGVPYWYTNQYCRVNREGRYLHVYSDDLSHELAAHEITWSYRDSFCIDQYADIEPEEQPSAPVTTTITQLEIPERDECFAKFNFERGL